MSGDSSDRDEKRRPGYIYDPAAPLPEHLRPPPTPEPVKSRLRDSDSGEAAQRLKSATYSLLGIVLGAGIGLWYSLATGKPPLLYMSAFALALWAIVFFGTRYLAERAGSIGASLYFHDGASTPGPREYSLAESLAARGRYEQAAEEYEYNALQHPDDPEPWLRLARLQRDALHQPAAAAASFERALSLPGLKPGPALLTRRELIELYLFRLKDARRALPQLEHLLAAGGPAREMEWARRELDEAKRSLEWESDGHA